MTQPALRRQIWLIGGTSDSAELAPALAAAGLPCTVTVATESARSLYPSAAALEIQVGRLVASEIDRFLRDRAIRAIVDASHPFAVEISQQAIAAAAAAQIPYLRYERPALPATATAGGTLPDFATLLEGDYLTGRRVLLTVGCKVLPQFQPWQSRATLFARVLPTVAALAATSAAGFAPARTLALRPPIGADLERALWQQWQIEAVVTKASGRAGGEAVKQQVAAELGIPLWTIARPALAYPQQTSASRDVLKFCYHHLND